MWALTISSNCRHFEASSANIVTGAVYRDVANCREKKQVSCTLAHRYRSISVKEPGASERRLVLRMCCAFAMTTPAQRPSANSILIQATRGIDDDSVCWVIIWYTCSE